MARNKYAGKCFRCHCDVPEGAGHFQRMNGRWVVRCLRCVGKGNDKGESVQTSTASSITRRTEPQQ